MNFKITKLEIENFRSIQDKVTLDLKPGLFSIEGINYTEEEIANAVEKFKNAVADIKAHKFEPTNDKKNCKYCSHKDFCNMNVM